MVVLATLALIAWAIWRDASGLAVGLMVSGLLVHVLLAVRLGRSLEGGIGGHAEWVREMSLRPRLARGPAGLVGLALICAGLVVAAVSR